jgi:hypothetical protein
VNQAGRTLTHSLGLVILPMLCVGSLWAAGEIEPEVSLAGMEARCEKEVIELHQFFEDWFNGVLPPTDEAFRRFEVVMAERFMIISPEGVPTERQELVERLRQAHGIWRRTRQPGRIWIENLRVRHQVGQQAMVLYEEWQEIDGETRGRLSTAVLQQRTATPNGVEWLHLHEVWLPD